MELKELTDCIPEIIKFILPGYITLLTMGYFTGHKVSDNSWVVSAAISFSTIAVLECGAECRHNPWTSWGLVVACIAVDIALGIFAAAVLRSSWWENVIRKMFRISKKQNILSFYSTPSKGANVRVLFKTMDEQVVGHLDVCDDTLEEGFFSVSEPRVYDSSGVTELYSRAGTEAVMVIPYTDVKFIEVFDYKSKDSEK